MAQALFQHKREVLRAHSHQYLILLPYKYRHLYRSFRVRVYHTPFGGWVAEWLHIQRDTLILQRAYRLRVNNLRTGIRQLYCVVIRQLRYQHRVSHQPRVSVQYAGHILPYRYRLGLQKVPEQRCRIVRPFSAQCRALAVCRAADEALRHHHARTTFPIPPRYNLLLRHLHIHFSFAESSICPQQFRHIPPLRRNPLAQQVNRHYLRGHQLTHRHHLVVVLIVTVFFAEGYLRRQAQVHIIFQPQLAHYLQVVIHDSRPFRLCLLFQARHLGCHHALQGIGCLAHSRHHHQQLAFRPSHYLAKIAHSRSILHRCSTKLKYLHLQFCPGTQVLACRSIGASRLR